ncbi:MAG: hypothetical protein Q8Q44_06175, partial [Nocardioides sp.]|nr:hypothetical protein [Nocardioides sp.]
MTCSFVPPYLLRRIAATRGHGVAAEVASRCTATLLVDEVFRVRRQEVASASPVPLAAPAAWTIHTADNTSSLPGRPVRSAGEPPIGDAAVDEAAYGVEGSLALFASVYGRRSYDDAGAPVVATVHYGRSYDNAFWDGR